MSVHSVALGNGQTQDMSAKEEGCEACRVRQSAFCGEDKTKSQDSLGKLEKCEEKRKGEPVGTETLTVRLLIT